MEANELRIGNYVEFTGDWVAAVRQWDEEDWYYLTEATLKMDDIKPIILSEEWLLKLGFTYTQDGMGFGGFELDRTDAGFIYDSVDYNVIIKHVHQLQNLYFALTGEELNIKEQSNSAQPLFSAH